MATSRNMQTPSDYSNQLYESLQSSDMIPNDQFSETLPTYVSNPAIEMTDVMVVDAQGFANEADQFDDFGENSRKEREILMGHRVKLIEYIHDCKVLFPFMKQNKVFKAHECEIIDHEITGQNKMDKFIDIILTKGPHAVGMFHESLGKDYPFVFDMLTRLFNSANIELPPSRQLREDSNDSAAPSEVETKENSLRGGRGGTVYHSMRRNNPSIRQTIRRHIDELTMRCEAVKSQRDELQQALLQRERDINALLSHRDQQIQQKYEDMLSLLANWRELMTHQSDGSIQKMQELLSEQESVKEAYELLEGEYMLVFSELSAARDRISKLLAHLEKMETEFSLAQEQKEELNDKILMQQGEIQRMERRFERLKVDLNSHTSSMVEHEVEEIKIPKITCLKGQLEGIMEDRNEFEKKMKVAQLERKEAIVANDCLQLKLHDETLKYKKLEQEILKLQSQDPISPLLHHSISEPGKKLFSKMTTSNGIIDEGPVQQVSKCVPLTEKTIVMPVNEMGMVLKLAVVVSELVEGGNAVKAGVWLGDEIHQVNHIKIPSDREPLAFTQRLFHQASNTITLSIKRPATDCYSSSSSSSLHIYSPNQLQLNAASPLTPKHESTTVQFTKFTSAGLLIGSGSRLRPQKLKSRVSNFNGSIPAKFCDGVRDSDTASEDSTYDDTFTNTDTDCGSPSHSQAHSHMPQEGIITSPTVSLKCRDFQHFTSPLIPHMSQFDFPTTTLTSQVSSYSLLTMKESMRICDGDYADDAFRSLDDLLCSITDPLPNEVHPSLDESNHCSDDISTPYKRPYSRPRHAMRRKVEGHQKRDHSLPKRLSRSLDDLDIVDMLCSHTDLARISHKHIEDCTRQVILPFGQLGQGLSIIGGRGNCLYIHSERNNERGLKTGDQIIQICGRLAIRMTYAEAIGLMTKYNSRGKDSVLTVRHNMEGYLKLNLITRDNFYVRAKVSHKSRFRPELSFELGDVFHVVDTKPNDQPDMWQVEKLNSRGQTTDTGCIPIHIEWENVVENLCSQSLPRLIKNNLGPLIGQKIELTLPTHKLNSKVTSSQCVFKLYQPVKELAVTECRPVILFGVYELEFSECLTTHSIKHKFAFPKRVSKDKMITGSEEKIIETVQTKNDGVLQSTIDDVIEVTRSGRHCVLTLSPNDLSKFRVSSLHPIIIALHPHSKSMKLKMVGGRLPRGFAHEVLGPATVNQIKERVRKIQPYVTGQINLSSPINTEELVNSIYNLVAVQQKNMLWELDLP